MAQEWVRSMWDANCMIRKNLVFTSVPFSFFRNIRIRESDMWQFKNFSRCTRTSRSVPVFCPCFYLFFCPCFYELPCKFVPKHCEAKIHPKYENEKNRYLILLFFGSKIKSKGEITVPHFITVQYKKQ